MDGDSLRPLIDGATYLFTNEHERQSLQQKTGWSNEEIASKVDTWVSPLGENGVRIEPAGGAVVTVAPPKVEHIADPTGVGDAFRAGYLAGVAR